MFLTVFLTVTLEAARWAWFLNPYKAIKMLDWTFEAAKGKQCVSANFAKYKEMKEEKEHFINPTGELLEPDPLRSRQPTKVF